MGKGNLGFEELKKELIEPVKLSDTERKKFKDIFTKIHEVIEDTESKVLEMDRDKAYRYMEIFLEKFSVVEKEFQDPKKERPTQREPEPEREIVPKPEAHKEGFFLEIFNKLTAKQQRVARDSLDCVKTAFSFIESGEAPPEAVLCPHCNYEEMIKCIIIEDPSIKDEMDQDLEKPITSN